MAHFLCHLGAHILEPFCSISILPKTVNENLKQLFIRHRHFLHLVFNTKWLQKYGLIITYLIAKSEEIHANA